MFLQRQELLSGVLENEEKFTRQANKETSLQEKKATRAIHQESVSLKSVFSCNFILNFNFHTEFSIFILNFPPR